MTLFKHRPNFKLWVGLLIIGVAIGIAGAGNVLLNGHSAVYNVTREIPWGILIARMPFLKQLLKKMSAKLGPMMQRKPKS